MSQSIMRLEEYDTEPRYQATVVSSERITPEQSSEEVRELVLDVDREDFPYQIGQSIGVLAPGSPEFGNKHHFRLYSVADLPAAGEAGMPRLRIAVRRCSYVDEYSGEEFKGIASNFLCDLKSGDKLTVAGPYGLANRP